MKIKHNIPAAAYRSDPVTPEYQAEVDRSTEKAMRAYERAQRRLRAAERRLQQIQERAGRATAKSKASARELAVVAELVEMRRAELREIEALVMAAPASAQHRGTRSYRPIPLPGRNV